MNVISHTTQVSVERGLPFSQAQAMCLQVLDPHEGFYVTSQVSVRQKCSKLQGKLR